MGDNFSSTPYDGHHDVTNSSGNDWRSKGGLGGMWDRFTSYGNFAGPGNRIDVEQSKYVAQQKAANPNYSEFHDPKLQSDPRYRPIDGVDAAAMKHDEGYGQHLGDANMFSWQGLRNVHDVDRALVNDTQREMDKNGSKYSDEARTYTEAERGFFGGRVMGVDAVDWTKDKAGQAANGIGNFVSGLGQSTSVGDAANRIGTGAVDAGRWIGSTANQAWNGVSNAYNHAADMGWAGMAGTAAGLANVAGAGALELGSRAVSGAQSLASKAVNSVEDGAAAAWNGAKNAGAAAGNAISNTASAAWDGATNLAGQAGSAISNGASALASGASNVGHSIASGASKAWDVATSW